MLCIGQEFKTQHGWSIQAYLNLVTKLTNVVEGGRYSGKMLFWKTRHIGSQSYCRHRQIPLKKSVHSWVEDRWCGGGGHSRKNTSLETPIIRLLKRDDGKTDRREERRLNMLVFKWVLLVSPGLRWSPMLLLGFWRSSVVHLCAYVNAREGKGERKEFKNDGVAFANHSPGVH